MPKTQLGRQCLTLYKKVLKLHRGLPSDLKCLGDSYVREEFRRHKNVNEKEATLFHDEWVKYYKTLARQLAPQGILKGELGRSLDAESLDQMTDAQLWQLLELKNEALKDGKN
uniref:Succinate dehydrogenase assembly factor 3 n=1 Tax=Romanomermis culicivorax TaxID=13658 RepID=A0A915J0X9_ROMCU